MNTEYPQSATTRPAVEAARLDRIDEAIRRIGMSLGALEMRYPSLIARQVLDDAEYPKAFPHLLMSACPIDAVPSACPERASDHASRGARGGHDDDLQRATTCWCLSPAVCYHAYAQLVGRVARDSIVITARGRCFRAERAFAPGIRQVEFDMREIVLVGEKDWIDSTVQTARHAVESVAHACDLSGEWEVAEDPFFLPVAAGKALMQRLLKVKLEYQWPRAGGLALASINRHGTFFGERFRITNADGQPMHTACVAVGLDRWAHLGSPFTETNTAPAGAAQEAQS